MPRSEIRSKSVRQAASNSSRSPGGRGLQPEQGREARLHPGPLRRVGDVLAERRRQLLARRRRVVALGDAGPARGPSRRAPRTRDPPRTPGSGRGASRCRPPRRRRTSPAPTRGGSSRSRRSPRSRRGGRARRASVACRRSLRSCSSSSRPTNGGSTRLLRPAPRRPATTRTARHAGTGAVLPRRSCSPAASKTIASPAARWVASPTSTVPGGAAPWRREAVLTRSPATIPWPCAPTTAAASPVSTAARACGRSPPGAARPGTAATRSSAARTARSASSSRAVGVPQTAMTASPMNFSTAPPYRSTTSRATSK